MIKVSFYESGKGETIVIEFPDGGLGIVDAHPSAANTRPSISELVRGRDVHFICLTHPHSDHGLDILEAMRSATSVGQFWHSVDDTRTLIFSYTQQNVFPGIYTQMLTELREGWAKFLVDLYDEVLSRTSADPKFLRLIDSGQSTVSISDTQLHFLAPSQEERNKFITHMRERLEGKNIKKPDENHISIVLCLEYAGSSILLGADALRRNWQEVIENFRKKNLPRPSLIKVPHHGAKNAWSPEKRKSYVREFTKSENRPHTVLFAGDSQHPQHDVFNDLKENTDLICLANGLKAKNQSSSNPLGIELEGAISFDDSLVCNAEITYKIETDGAVSLIRGKQCSFCACLDTV